MSIKFLGCEGDACVKGFEMQRLLRHVTCPRELRIRLEELQYLERLC